MSVNVRKIVFAGVTGALYAAMTLSLAFIAYGPIQFRIAEALCILPFFFPSTVPGLFIGCIAANLISPYPLDIIVGSLATLLAVTCTMLLGKLDRNRAVLNPDGNRIIIRLLACAPPVVFNAVIIGALIAWYETGGGPAFLPAMALFGFQVGLGELAVMYAVGLPLMLLLPKSKLFTSLSAQYRL